jgi:hypothetical protein
VLCVLLQTMPWGAQACRAACVRIAPCMLLPGAACTAHRRSCGVCCAAARRGRPGSHRPCLAWQPASSRPLTCFICGVLAAPSRRPQPESRAISSAAWCTRSRSLYCLHCMACSGRRPLLTRYRAALGAGRSCRDAPPTGTRWQQVPTTSSGCCKLGLAATGGARNGGDCGRLGRARLLQTVVDNDCPEQGRGGPPRALHASLSWPDSQDPPSII